MTYNLCEEPWIRVRYLDHTVKEIGIRKLFQDAEKIEELLPPVFRGEQIHFYCALLIRLLTTIVMSAYYKEENNYAAKSLRYLDALRENGLYSETIQKYLDKYQDRFDLFSKEHPFLQNAALFSSANGVEHFNDDTESKKDREDRLTFLTWNPYAPTKSSKVFGRIDLPLLKGENLLDQYSMTSKECAYVLLYIGSIGMTPCSAQYSEVSLGKDLNIYTVLKCETLAETILANILPLKNSSRPLDDDAKADCPVWELDRIRDLESFENVSILQNRLLMSFFPGISILITKADGNYIQEMVRIRKVKKENDSKKANPNTKVFLPDGKGVNPDFTKLMIENYQEPYTIIRKKVDNPGKKNETITYPYMIYDPEYFNTMALCISATTHTPEKSHCLLLDERSVPDRGQLYLYIREPDQYKVSLTSSGYLNGNRIKTYQVLKDQDLHKTAEKYQFYYGKTLRFLGEMLAKAYCDGAYKDVNGNLKCQELQKTAKNMLSSWMEDDFFGLFTDSLTEENAFENAAKRIREKAVEIYFALTKSQPDIFEVVKYKKQLYGVLMNIEKEM